MIRSFVHRLTGALVLGTLSSACDVTESFRVLNDDRAVERVLVSPDSVVRAAVRDTIRLTAVAIGPANRKITEAVMEWTSGDPSVARSVGDGRFVAVGIGAAELFATTRGSRGVGRVTVVR